MDTAGLLRRCRRRAALTQARLAARAGTTQPAVARWESGAGSPRVETLARLLRACGAEVRVTAKWPARAAGRGRQAPAVPRDLPLLRSLSWFDRDWRALAPLDMLRRYEAGWRHRGVLADPTAAELSFVRALVARYGSALDV